MFHLLSLLGSLAPEDRMCACPPKDLHAELPLNPLQPCRGDFCTDIFSVSSFVSVARELRGSRPRGARCTVGGFFSRAFSPPIPTPPPSPRYENGERLVSYMQRTDAPASDERCTVFSSFFGPFSRIFNVTRDTTVGKENCTRCRLDTVDSWGQREWSIFLGNFNKRGKKIFFHQLCQYGIKYGFRYRPSIEQVDRWVFHVALNLGWFQFGMNV